MTDLLPAAPQMTAESFIDEWERQPGEPARAFSAFAIFRDMGDERGVMKVRTEAGFSSTPKTLMGWATTWRWIERANAYDRMIDRRRQMAHIEEVEAMARRQVEIGQSLQYAGLEWVREELDTAEKRAKNLSANAALRFIDTGVELEREGLGMGDKGGGDITNVTVNVLDGGTKSEIFDKIDQMAANAAAVERMIAERSTVLPVMDIEEIVDGEVVGEDP